MRWAERITAIVLLALCVLWIKLAVDLPFPAFARAAKMGPGHYPIAVAGLLASLAVLLLWQTFRCEKHAASAEDDEEQSRNPQGFRHLIIGFGFFLVYVILVPLIGFVLASMVFVFCFIRLIGQFNYLLSGALALGIPALLWIVFAYLLTVPLPKGPFGF
ncbi:MAG: tripartite tricarboxylate transporter TctB family protein [Desulfobacterales bacterium]|nr:MAG: tripartite tricarboxylate transporter TctB family protein [Desulfobacterales bacterium]